MKYKTLNNGMEIPMVGSGTNTFGKEGNQYTGALRGDTEEMDWAIENGYRHFDAAQIYHNEEVVGSAIRKSGLPREDFFITSKLNTFDGFHGADWARAEIEESLKKLQTGYLDLFLIHKPWGNDEEMRKAWAVLEEYYERGVLKSIGVSNFEQEQLHALLANCRVKPAANQIKSQAGHWNDELIAYNKSNDIATVAWSPLGGIDETAKRVLKEIGSRYNKTYAQTVLRYQIERGVIVIPKSHNKDRQAEGLSIFDFELTDEERGQIAALQQD